MFYSPPSTFTFSGLLCCIMSKCLKECHNLCMRACNSYCYDFYSERTFESMYLSLPQNIHIFLKTHILFFTFEWQTKFLMINRILVVSVLIIHHPLFLVPDFFTAHRRNVGKCFIICARGSVIVIVFFF